MLTTEDNALLTTLTDKVKALRQHIGEGRPYVWLLRITPAEFNTLEARLRDSLQGHGGRLQLSA